MRAEDLDASKRKAKRRLKADYWHACQDKRRSRRRASEPHAGAPVRSTTMGQKSGRIRRPAVGTRAATGSRCRFTGIAADQDLRIRALEDSLQLLL